LFLGFVAFFIFIAGNKTVMSYLYAMYISFGVAAAAGFIAVMAKAEKFEMKGWPQVTRQVFKYGLVTQFANLLSIGNNRMSFFFIKHFTGLSALGIYTAGVQLTEGLKLIGQSIAVVQFSTISNSRDENYARVITVRLMKITLLFTFAALAVLLILPESVYTWIFSDKFAGIKPVIIALSPGVMALAANNIFSHYFSGMGNPEVNLYAKVVGLGFTIILAILLIPTYGFIGAGITASVSYTATVIYQYFIFRKKTKTRLIEWVPARGDLREFKKIVKEAIGKSDG
jgi:O-antigen/teichoic acid export membrane protein